MNEKIKTINRILTVAIIFMLGVDVGVLLALVKTGNLL